MGRLQREILYLLKESQSDSDEFDSMVLEANIPHEMRWKEWDIIEDEDGGKPCLYWVTQQRYTKAQLNEFKKALKKLYGDIFDSAFVIVRDDSVYNIDDDLTSGYGDLIYLDDTIKESALTEKQNDINKSETANLEDKVKSARQNIINHMNKLRSERTKK